MRDVPARLAAAWRALAREQRLAAAAAAALFLTMFLPWYTVTPARAASFSLTPFRAWSFVEAAILLVAVGVLALLFARAEGKRFRLPFGDGGVVLGAGAWVVFLVFYRQFDKPEVGGAVVGVDWGMFVTILAGGALVLAGLRLRGPADRADPPTRVAMPDEMPTAVRRRDDGTPSQLSFEDQDRLM